MPVLKIKKADGTWQEVWGALTGTNAPKIIFVTIPASGWSGSNDLYFQELDVGEVNVNSKLDLQPTASQVANLQDEEISLMIENNNGVITCYAIGNKPSSDYIMQVLITEVSYL